MDLDFIDQVFKESDGFSWQSPSWISQQDRTLKEYRYTLTTYLIKSGKAPKQLRPFKEINAAGNTVADDHNDRWIFPEDAELQIDYVCLYLITVYHKLKAGLHQRDKIRLGTLTQRRTCILFWITKGLKRDIYFHFPRARFNQRTNERIQFIHRKFGFYTKPTKKVYFSKVELIQLMDTDTLETPNIAVAEQHHVAWLLGLCCGVRPGSLAVAKKRPGQCLTWGDIKIWREDKEGRFDGGFAGSIRFKYLEGSRDDADKEQYEWLEMVIRSPRDPANIPVSVIHRLLVMAVPDAPTMPPLTGGSRHGD